METHICILYNFCPYVYVYTVAVLTAVASSNCLATTMSSGGFVITAVRVINTVSDSIKYVVQKLSQPNTLYIPAFPLYKFGSVSSVRLSFVLIRRKLVHMVPYPIINAVEPETYYFILYKTFI